MLVDAQAQYNLAQTNLRAAERNREILAKVTTDATKGNFNAGHHVTRRRRDPVPAGAAGPEGPGRGALFVVQILDPVWVRVPVYVGDLAKLASDRDAEVRGLADAPAPRRAPRQTGSGPPLGRPPGGDRQYLLRGREQGRPAPDRPARRGDLALKGEDENLIVPRASLVRDIHGNTWVYMKTGDHAFSRRLIMVDRIVGDLAVVASGKLKPGDKVITAGTAELFGAEFGGFK